MVQDEKRAAAGEGAESTPLSEAELRASFLRPDLAAALVLGSPDRVGRTLAGGLEVGLLMALLTSLSLFATIPYGAASLPAASLWKVTALYTGSLLICLPSLHIFLQFVGITGGLLRNVSLSLVIPASAALFTFGFAPIIWFIDLTTAAGDESVVTPEGLSGMLLAIALLLGVVQMKRCLTSSNAVRDEGHFGAVTVVWVVLLLFIAWRMAGYLELRA